VKIHSAVLEKSIFKKPLPKQLDKMSREQQRYYIFVSWKNGREPAQIHNELVNAEGEQALSLSTVRRWIHAFEDGDESISDKACSGRPCEAVTPENIAKVDDLINDDPHISTSEIANQVGISRERIGHILHNELNLHKVCAKWVPHALSEDNKKKRVELSKELLGILDRGYRNIITGDETWIYFFTISSKEANKVWVEMGENRPQIVRTAQHSKKRMFCIFFTVDGVIARIVMKKGQTVNGRLYANSILPEVFSNFMEKGGRTTVRDVMLHHDNAAPHKAAVVTEYLRNERVKLLPHPPYSPDLAPCDFFLFPRIKKELKGKSFNKVEHLARAVQAVVDGIPKEDYEKSFQSWQNRLQRCIDFNGEYFEGME
jgi:histone-lysine N-methyltransferase SETMAR